MNSQPTEDEEQDAEEELEARYRQRDRKTSKPKMVLDGKSSANIWNARRRK